MKKAELAFIFALMIVVVVLFFACNSPSSGKAEVSKFADERIDIQSTDDLITVNSVRFKMISIEGGDFILGKAGYNLNPPHNVKLSDYKIGETPVTQELFEVVMGYNPSECKSESIGEVQKLRPVEYVSWFDAVSFCNRLTELKMGSEHCVYDIAVTKYFDKQGSISEAKVTADWTKKGFRLPTEAEWEWAARCGDDYKYAGSNNLDEVAWNECNAKGKTHQVKKLKANKFGLYDMTGNVWEWCWDLSGPIKEGAYMENPQGNDKGLMRVHRGACWYCPLPDEKGRYFVYFREAFINPDKRQDKIGFRVARYK